MYINILLFFFFLRTLYKVLSLRLHCYIDTEFTALMLRGTKLETMESFFFCFAENEKNDQTIHYHKKTWFVWL